MITVIGERLAEIRKDHGDTQQTLADKLNVTKYTVSSWEQEKSEPNHDTLAINLLKSVLNISKISPVHWFG